MWNATEHSDDENLIWSLGRAMEWGNFPTFISQPIVPVALLYWPWKTVVIATVAVNTLWAVLIRYRFVIVSLAFWAAVFVRLKWFACPIAAYMLYRRGIAVLAFFWPLAILLPGGMLSVKVGRIQNMFMQRLGHRPTEANAAGA